jgi:predicted glycogen debranching enzyme
VEGQDLSTLGFDGLTQREWLTTNGIGGYASSTVPCLNTRKYHGLLVAAMTPPVRRMVLLSRVEETVSFAGNAWPLASNEYPGIIHPRGIEFLRCFSRSPVPRWAYQGDGWTIEKTLRLVRGQNTVCISYTLLAGDHPVELEMRPMLALRPIHELMYQWNGRLIVEKRGKLQYRVPPTARTPEVFFAHDGAFASSPAWYLNSIYRRDMERGYAGLEDVWSPATLRWALYPGQTANFICSADTIDFDAALSQADLQCDSVAFDDTTFAPVPVPAPLKRSLCQFSCTVPTEAARQRGPGITQYPWAPPSVRDALIAFSGTYLVTGRFADGLNLLCTIAGTLKDGLIASSYPEDGSGPRYDGADVSLWFVNAVHQYRQHAHDVDPAAMRPLFDAVRKIISAYSEGTTPLAISVDRDHLLQTTDDTRATTWMDARPLTGVPLTPRVGKPVELNALWYNALRIGADLCASDGDAATATNLRAQADATRDAFNAYFWNDVIGACFDVLTPAGPDASLRPNQVLAASLAHPVLAADRCKQMLERVRDELLTPYGLRTLAPSDPRYCGRYAGSVSERDRAQHNGTVYPWLLGPFVTAWTREHARDDAAIATVNDWLRPCLNHLNGPGIGNLPELFDGEAPHHPGGAIASLLSVAEIARAYVEDANGAAVDLPPWARVELDPPASRPSAPSAPV